MPSPSQIARLAALEAKVPAIANRKPHLSGARVRRILRGFYQQIDGEHLDPTFDEHSWVMTATDEELDRWWNTGQPDRPWRDFPRPVTD